MSWQFMANQGPSNGNVNRGLVAARSGTSSGRRPIGWLVFNVVTSDFAHLTAFKMTANGMLSLFWVMR
eukprot:2672134-Pleurochrysis_carterae.AAC.1